MAEDAKPTPKTVDDLPSKGQPRDDESLGDNHRMVQDDSDQPKGTGDRNQQMLRHG